MRGTNVHFQGATGPTFGGEGGGGQWSGANGLGLWS